MLSRPAQTATDVHTQQGSSLGAHTHVLRPTPVPLPIRCSCSPPLPSTLRGQTHRPACFWCHGVRAMRWHWGVAEQDPCQRYCLPCCLRGELGFARTVGCDGSARQHSGHLISFFFFSFLRISASFQFSRGNSLWE